MYGDQKNELLRCNCLITIWITTWHVFGLYYGQRKNDYHIKTNTMKVQYHETDLSFNGYALDKPGVNKTDFVLGSPSRVGKKSFLVFKHNKYTTVPIENIAFFYVKYDSSILVCRDRQEYPVHYSLKQIQNLVNNKHFFRLNKQYLVNFDAVKEVEHYFARKLLVKLTVAGPDKLLVSKQKACCFMRWLENR